MNDDSYWGPATGDGGAGARAQQGHGSPSGGPVPPTWAGPAFDHSQQYPLPGADDMAQTQYMPPVADHSGPGGPYGGVPPEHQGQPAPEATRLTGPLFRDDPPGPRPEATTRRGTRPCPHAQAATPSPSPSLPGAVVLRSPCSFLSGRIAAGGRHTFAAMGLAAWRTAGKLSGFVTGASRRPPARVRSSGERS